MRSRRIRYLRFDSADRAYNSRQRVKLRNDMGEAPTGGSLRTVCIAWDLKRLGEGNGKIERGHNSLKGERIRPGTPLSLEDAGRLVEVYVANYNDVSLNSPVGCITPKDMRGGQQQEIQA